MKKTLVGIAALLTGSAMVLMIATGYAGASSLVFLGGGGF